MKHSNFALTDFKIIYLFLGNLPEITDDNSCTQNQSLVVNANEALNCSTSSNAVANITYRSTPAIEFWT